MQLSMPAYLAHFVHHALAKLAERTTWLGLIAHFLPHLSPDIAAQISTTTADFGALLLIVMPDPPTAGSGPQAQAALIAERVIDGVLAKLPNPGSTAAVLLACFLMTGCISAPKPGQPAESTSIGAVAASVVIPAKTYPERVYRQTAFLAMEAVVVSERAVSDPKLAAQTLGLLQTALAQNKNLRAEMNAAGAGRPAWFELHIGLAATSMVDVGVAVGIADAFDFTKLASLNPIEWVQFALGKIKEANSLYWMVTDTQAQLADIEARGTGPTDADYAAIDAVLNQALADLGNAAKPAGAPSISAPIFILPPAPASAPLPRVSVSPVAS